MEGKMPNVQASVSGLARTVSVPSQDETGSSYPSLYICSRVGGKNRSHEIGRRITVVNLSLPPTKLP